MAQTGAFAVVRNENDLKYWRVALSAEGKKYYFNKITKVTQWTPPPGFVEPTDKAPAIHGQAITLTGSMKQELGIAIRSAEASRGGFSGAVNPGGRPSGYGAATAPVAASPGGFQPATAYPPSAMAAYGSGGMVAGAMGPSSGYPMVAGHSGPSSGGSPAMSADRAWQDKQFQEEQQRLRQQYMMQGMAASSPVAAGTGGPAVAVQGPPPGMTERQWQEKLFQEQQQLLRQQHIMAGAARSTAPGGGTGSPSSSGYNGVTPVGAGSPGYNGVPNGYNPAVAGGYVGTPQAGYAPAGGFPATTAPGYGPGYGSPGTGAVGPGYNPATGAYAGSGSPGGYAAAGYSTPPGGQPQFGHVTYTTAAPAAAAVPPGGGAVPPGGGAVGANGYNNGGTPYGLNTMDALASMPRVAAPTPISNLPADLQSTNQFNVQSVVAPTTGFTMAMNNNEPVIQTASVASPIVKRAAPTAQNSQLLGPPRPGGPGGPGGPGRGKDAGAELVSMLQSLNLNSVSFKFTPDMLKAQNDAELSAAIGSLASADDVSEQLQAEIDEALASDTVTNGDKEKLLNLKGSLIRSNQPPPPPRENGSNPNLTTMGSAELEDLMAEVVAKKPSAAGTASPGVAGATAPRKNSSPTVEPVRKNSSPAEPPKGDMPSLTTMGSNELEEMMAGIVTRPTKAAPAAKPAPAPISTAPNPTPAVVVTPTTPTATATPTTTPSSPATKIPAAASKIPAKAAPTSPAPSIPPPTSAPPKPPTNKPVAATAQPPQPPRRPSNSNAPAPASDLLDPEDEDRPRSASVSAAGGKAAAQPPKPTRAKKAAAGEEKAPELPARKPLPAKK